MNSKQTAIELWFWIHNTKSSLPMTENDSVLNKIQFSMIFHECYSSWFFFNVYVYSYIFLKKKPND